MLEANWTVRESPCPGQVEAIVQEFGIRKLVAELLLQRGFSGAAEIGRYLNPRLQDLSDPFLLPNMAAAVDRIFEAVDRNETVVLYGDYDVDGVTSLTLLHAFLRAYGLEARTFLPHRMEDGYGLSDHGLERCLAEEAPSLIIAVDCGTSSIQQVGNLREQGIDVIIVDHHESNTGQLPPAVAVVNPKLGDAFHYFCTAGLIFKLGHALQKRRRNDRLDLKEWLDVVALGTVADLVPLVDENRLLVRKGLQQLARTRHAGLVALKKVAGVGGELESNDIGFKLGPRLNAAGRLDTASVALDLLRCANPAEADRLAADLDGQNRDRQNLEQRIRDQAVEMLRRQGDQLGRGIVLASEEWHAGVVGIVASRVVKEFYRPSFIIAFDEEGIGKGSGRSIAGISLVDALKACDDLLVSGGGHQMAAGLTLRRENLEAFRERFAAYLEANAPAELFTPRLEIDLVATLAEINLDLLESYDLVHPMGMGNPAPLFMSRGVRLAEEPRVLKEKHLRLPLQQNGARVEAMWFNAAHLELPPGPWDMAYRISRNVYKGRSSVSLTIEALRTARS
ncbi:MAG: single-stranded-DNA-specific exonuclease RecJ [Verrucomicrobia bacterium]|nr:single-stranded-DNA-specific exonuclease RecJ [Verrucomicrobiota bacterium]